METYDDYDKDYELNTKMTVYNFEKKFYNVQVVAKAEEKADMQLEKK